MLEGLDSWAEVLTVVAALLLPLVIAAGIIQMFHGAESIAERGISSLAPSAPQPVTRMSKQEADMIAEMEMEILLEIEAEEAAEKVRLHSEAAIDLLR